MQRAVTDGGGRFGETEVNLPTQHYLTSKLLMCYYTRTLSVFDLVDCNLFNHRVRNSESPFSSNTGHVCVLQIILHRLTNLHLRK